MRFSLPGRSTGVPDSSSCMDLGTTHQKVRRSFRECGKILQFYGFGSILKEKAVGAFFNPGGRNETNSADWPKLSV